MLDFPATLLMLASQKNERRRKEEVKSRKTVRGFPRATHTNIPSLVGTALLGTFQCKWERRGYKLEPDPGIPGGKGGNTSH